MNKISIQGEDFDVAKELAELRGDATNIGGITSFVGLVRDNNLDDEVLGMSLEHYPGMTEKSLEKIIVEACERWEVLSSTVIHRVGDLLPADQIVFVAVASSHRGDAFEACEFIMDYLKTRAPFWKKELLKDGTARWVDARETDSSAANRWA